MEREPIRTEFLFYADLQLDMPQNVGAGPHGNRQIIRVVSGTVEGPKIKGATLVMSGDWLLLRPDGVGELDVRSTIKTDDDQLVYMHYRGLMHARQEIMEGMFQGKPVAAADLYLRVSPFFETSSQKYDWLNRTVAVGTARVGLPRFELFLYSVL
ncbi:MAG: DUF3237 domain-containing protein [Spirochaetia bacterium]|jgi:hypothetical protein